MRILVKIKSFTFNFNEKPKLNPLVSIITPCYNSADFVRLTINSVLEQTYTNWELIVIDDKSKDDTCKVIEAYTQQHSNIRLIKLAQNGGVANARNIGLEEAKGKYIAFLDSDDIWLKEKLAKQVTDMEEQSLPMTFCAYNRIDEAGAIISRKIEVPTSVNYRQLLSHNVIIFSTSLTLKTVIGTTRFKKVGHEDWIFWLDIFKKPFSGYGINEPLVLYRIRQGSVSSNKLKVIGFTWKILRESEKLGFFESVYHFTKYAFATVWKRLR
ncbi:glycosyltransferase family 2 protein [Pedobacter xixiisoli]|uniref:Teichuronic acid biosynthesis glycosyltransferase TuaG n=1 Tax=Pedobacter xixiisoli TaxID=1476464 RepID=A0A286ACK4_9SPHI|nr:glycosyltransferase family 2 protein [Pedobacter xixiisoli]SOD19615.1 teichuronic acid biosynthesis glycosyltransferase TuaG [Pedobacter xixiisoli]